MQNGSDQETRVEQDSLGQVAVPAARMWGAQTQRSLQNFPIGDERMPTAIVHALALIKAAAAETNHELGLLEPAQRDAIVTAAAAIQRGELTQEFPLLVWQTGSGTQTNMNVNEVIAHHARAATGVALHPNDHVNRGQSSNDTFPTAMHIAAVLAIEHRLRPAVAGLRATLEGKRDAFVDVVKIGRTHLQDATPITLGQELSGWAAQLAAAEASIADALVPLCELPLGGTAVGTGIGTHPQFGARAIARIAARTGLPFTPMDNRFAGLAAHDACVRMSGALRQLATACMKVANDVRWLASGPRAGLGELRIPENEPGSSIMPGKVNPTQCEALTMVACQVLGNDAAIGFAGSQGNFELNVYKPVIAYNLLQSIGLLADACASFDLRCAQGIEPRRDVLAHQLERSLMLVTALSPVIGYDAAARIAHRAHHEGLSLREAAMAEGGLDRAELDRLLDPLAMTRPGR